MILEDIPDRADFLVEAAAAPDIKLFRHRDVNALDVVAVPDGLQKRVGEAEVEQILNRLLAEKVVDPINVGLGKNGMQSLIQRLR